ncbi:MAG: hypothetical protein A3J80_04785 [Desulfobacula sp. RIFOXYB2_FULL_45_6]|nr:MAG: hypothetical protein A3J80_04785 [Desulfobacula sp. RIFOXYB2_FULL_45_6]
MVTIFTPCLNLWPIDPCIGEARTVKTGNKKNDSSFEPGMMPKLNAILSLNFFNFKQKRKKT